MFEVIEELTNATEYRNGELFHFKKFEYDDSGRNKRHDITKHQKANITCDIYMCHYLEVACFLV